MGGIAEEMLKFSPRAGPYNPVGKILMSNDTFVIVTH